MPNVTGPPDRTGFIAGGVAGGVAVIAIATAVSIFCLRKRAESKFRSGLRSEQYNPVKIELDTTIKV